MVNYIDAKFGGGQIIKDGDPARVSLGTPPGAASHLMAPMP